MKKTRLLVPAIIIILFAGGVTVWSIQDSCDAPKPVCEALENVRNLDGIQAVDLEYRVFNTDGWDPNNALAEWTIELSEARTPDEAGQDAELALGLVSGVAVDGENFRYNATVVSRPRQETIQKPGTTPDYALNVSGPDDVRNKVIRGYGLLDAGAVKVSNNSVVVETSENFRKIADYSVQHSYPAQIETIDQSLRYTPEQDTDLAMVDLVLDSGAKQNVESANVDRSALHIHTSSAEKTTATRSIVHWLDSRIPPHDEPLKYSLSSPGFSTVVEGWLGKVLPAELIPQPVHLPEGTPPWSVDPRAQDCSAIDVIFELGSPEAALGSRYQSIFAKNISGRPCAVQGLAEISFYNTENQPQTDISVDPVPDIQVGRVVIPAGEYALTTLQWKAMSTSIDPDETTSLQVALLPGFPKTTLTPQYEDRNVSLDILDGGHVEVSPWVQARAGWGKPKN